MLLTILTVFLVFAMLDATLLANLNSKECSSLIFLFFANVDKWL